MLTIPHDIALHYSALLTKKAIPQKFHVYYRKWLRYYLDFCHKYGLQVSDMKSLPQFITKLREKRQTGLQQKQASHAVSLYYALAKKSPIPVTQVETKKDSAVAARWKAAHKTLGLEIKTRHYSPKTLRAYSAWLWKFKAYTRNKEPEDLFPTDVKEFLTFLAVKQRVSASTQNQAFNALLFFYRHVLKKDFGEHKDIVRAKRKPYIPVVLSRKEIDRVLTHLSYPYDLVVKLLYGCGLRMFECLNLRIHNFNFDEEILTIHDGKGKKDRTVPIPRRVQSDLKAHLERVVSLHQRDMKEKYDGAFMFGAIEKKYRNASKELIWQWFFPAKTLTFVPETQERRRYHLHESYVNRAVREAARQARILKRVSAHTFRHSFASHLLHANYDIRTIQKLLGHSDVRTTMIYTHTVKSITTKEAKSPFDF